MSKRQDPWKSSGEDEALLPSPQEEVEIVKNPIKITLAGHTCAGKTEWLSSLVWEKVGAVSPEPDTTKHRTPVKISLPGRVKDFYIIIYDVPGQQFSPDILSRAKEELGKRPKPSQMAEFIKKYQDTPGAHHDDIQLLAHFQSCDVILYLVDCQCEPSADIEDEFELVRRLGRPVIAVLNFTAPHVQTRPEITRQWREAFELEGANGIVELDAFDKDPEAIRALGEKLINLFSGDALKAKFMRMYWQDQIVGIETGRIEKAVGVLADFLINAATFELSQSLRGNIEEQEAKKVLKADLRRMLDKKGEQFVAGIMEAFPEFDVAGKANETPLGGGDNGENRITPGLFGDSPHKQLIKSARRGAIIGGVLGAILAGSLSGGLGAPAGAGIGMAVGALLDELLTFEFRKTNFGRCGMELKLQVSRGALKSICVHGLALIDELRRRGVGSSLSIDPERRRQGIPPPDMAMELIKVIRGKNRWSRWAHEEVDYQDRKEVYIQLKSELAILLGQVGRGENVGMNTVVAGAKDVLAAASEGVRDRIRNQLGKHFLK